MRTAQQTLVSIVMPTRNQMAFLAESVNCVLAQGYANLELIVADGASTDGTQQWLAARAAEDVRLRWFSEPDTGPAQALNRALRLVRGTVVGWLNSDDLYTPGAIQRAVDALHHNPNWLMVYGHAQHVDGAGNLLGSYPTLWPDVPYARWAEGCFICQPTVFFKRTLQVLTGPLDESLKASFDFDYWLRVFKRMPQRVGFVDAVQAQSRLHDACITQTQRRTVALEGMQLLHRHLGHAPVQWAQTHVHELLQGPLPTAPAGCLALAEEVRSFVAQCSPYLGRQEHAKLLAHTEADARFATLSTPLAWLPAEWRLARFGQAISLGNFCHSAALLRQLRWRTGSGPFDWVFGSPEVTAHVLTDDFHLFLDVAQMEPVPVEQRKVAEANLCEHRYYRDQFGVRFMFNHHDPTQAQVHAYFVRCVDRLRAALCGPEAVLFVMVSQYQSFKPERYRPIGEQLRKHNPANALLVLHLAQPAVLPADAERVQLLWTEPGALALQVMTASPSNGVVFADPQDEHFLLQVMKAFHVAQHAHRDQTASSATDFDEAWYLRTHVDVAEGVAKGVFGSGWIHFESHGRREGRASRKQKVT